MPEKYLFIDAQVFQGNDWNRGMGKYSLEFIRALTSNEDYAYSKTFIVFSSRRELSDEASKKIKQAVPTAEWVHLDIGSPEGVVSWSELEAHNSQILNEKISKLRDQVPADYLLLSAFSDYVCPVFPTLARKIVICYDLIPLLYSRHYMQLPTFNDYLERFRALFSADIILTISQTTADDVAKYLGIVGEKVQNIGGAPITRNNKSSHMPVRPIHVHGKYVLMPSGQEFRKNNLNAVKGFVNYCKSYHDSSLKLVITSHFTEAMQKKIRQESGQIVFTGNVSESNIDWLYNNADCVLFASDYEGLGLPILEAVLAEKPIVCSNIGVFREISDAAFYFVDQTDPADIANGLARAVGKKDWDSHKSLYKSIEQQNSWGETASRAVSILNNQNITHKQPSSRSRIAVLCPNPQGYSEIGRLAMLLHPTLAERFDVDYFIEDSPLFHMSRSLRPNYLDKITNVYDAADFNQAKYSGYDAVVYHIGNSNYHVQTIKNALYLPGIAIVHDSDIADAFTNALADNGIVTADRIRSEELLDGLNKGNKTKYLTSVSNAQEAILVHSAYNKAAVEEISGGVPVVRANLPTIVPKMLNHSNGGKINIGIAGNLHPAKGISIIEKIASMNEIASRCNIYLFGLLALQDKDLIRLMSHKNIVLKTDLSDLEFQELLSKLDLSINYRMEYKGETSASVTNAMRNGVTPLVRNIGWYAELPDDCVIKVDNEEDVPAAIKQAVLHPGTLRNMGQKCYEYIARYYTCEEYVEKISQLIEKSNRDNFNSELSDLIKKGASKDELRLAITNWNPGKLNK